MEENQFWLSVWKLIVLAFVIVVVAGIGSCQATRYQARMAFEAALESGATPLAARCAALGEGQYADNCALIGAAEAEANRN